jgi:hypothetical protein
MVRTLYALLVGIDQYQAPVPALTGCVNDVRAIERHLQHRVAAPEQGGMHLAVRTLLDGAATRAAVIAGFREHLALAGPDDVALFYYSGHGSQAPVPRELRHLEADGHCETLVCWDSRMPGQYDLLDKEVGKLLSEVGAKKPHIAVVLDCCHSGTATRGFTDLPIRRAPADTRERPPGSLLVGAGDFQPETPTARTRAIEGSGWLLTDAARHVLLAACRDNQEAKEYNGDGERRGAFSYFLTQALAQSNTSPTYRDLYKRAGALVRANVEEQSPQIETTVTEDIDQPFLGGAISAGPRYFTAAHDAALGWVVDAGAVHGWLAPAGGEAIALAVFPAGATAAQLAEPGVSIGRAVVTAVRSDVSQIEISGVPDLDPNATYKVVVTGWPLARMPIRLEGDATALGLVRAALVKANPTGGPSLYVVESASGVDVAFRLVARDDQYIIARPADDRPIVAEIDGYTAASAALVVQRLEHIARWRATVNLTNPGTAIPTGALDIAVERVTQPSANPLDFGNEPREVCPSDRELRVEYAYVERAWRKPVLYFRVTNHSPQVLYCALLALSSRFAIDAMETVGHDKAVRLDPDASALFRLRFSVPDELFGTGVTELRDTLKLIASSAEFDATLLEQTRLDMPKAKGEAKDTVRGLGRSTPLSRLMRKVQTREADSGDGDEGFDDWTTAQVTVATVRPRDAAPVPQSGPGTRLLAGVTLEAHPALGARARLTSVPQTTRDLGHLALPAVLRSDPAAVRPFEFLASRGADPGLAVLELTEVADHTVVTRDAPLRIRAAVPLSPGEHVLAVGYDGEYYLPLGSGVADGNETVISLDALPAPVTAGTRDLKGAIRIMFQKLLSKPLDLPYNYPHLTAVEVDDAGALRYIPDRVEIARRVGAAKRVLLYVHGWSGDSRGMAASAALAMVDGVRLRDRYDVILAFDYESLHTRIDDTARELGAKLAEVGLGPDHGKTLHVVAHSMGGLVSRWFVEHEGGSAVVGHLTLLGTPNGGLPWPKLQEWASTALALALNGMTAVAWPAQVLTTLMALIEKVDVTVDQMEGDSPFFTALKTGADPHVPYALVAGNTSTIPESLRGPHGVAGLLDRLDRARLVHKVTALAFLGQPNDIAAAVASIHDVDDRRDPPPLKLEVACDHVSYFFHEAGLNALAHAVGQRRTVG